MGMPRGPRPGPRMTGAPRAPMGQPGPQPMTMMARPGMPPVPMGAQQVRPQQSFKYTPTARNPPAQFHPQVMPGQMVAPGGAPPPQQAVLVQGQKLIEIADELKVRPFYEKRMGQEVEADTLGDEFKGYVLRITGGNDKQGFPMKQGVLTNGRVRLLMAKGSTCYRPRR